MAEEEKSPTEGSKLNEPNPALDELKSSLEDISNKITGFDAKLTDYDQKLADLTNAPGPTGPQEEGGYVDKGWVPKDWNEVYAKVDELADKKAEEKLNSFAESQQKEVQDRAKQDAEINAEFDRQLGELEKAGKIPKIVDFNNDNDPGKVARQELFKLGIRYESPNLIKMSELRDQLKSIQPSGVNAPVGSSSGVVEAPKPVDYKEIHNKSMDQMVREEFPK